MHRESLSTAFRPHAYEPDPRSGRISYEPGPANRGKLARNGGSYTYREAAADRRGQPRSAPLGPARRRAPARPQTDAPHPHSRAPSPASRPARREENDGTGPAALPPRRPALEPAPAVLRPRCAGKTAAAPALSATDTAHNPPGAGPPGTAPPPAASARRRPGPQTRASGSDVPSRTSGRSPNYLCIPAGPAPRRTPPRTAAAGRSREPETDLSPVIATLLFEAKKRVSIRPPGLCRPFRRLSGRRQHVSAAGRHNEQVGVMDEAPLTQRIREGLLNRADQARGTVGDDQQRASQAAVLQVGEEGVPGVSGLAGAGR